MPLGRSLGARLRRCSSLFSVGQPLKEDERDTLLYVRGEGVYLYQDDGVCVLDSASNMFNVTLGYSCDIVKQAIADQLLALPYYNVHRG